VFAGPSGVGKSSLLNEVESGLDLETGKISDKVNQGRHTTRLIELLPLSKGGWAADTPGFSSLDLSFIVPRELQYFFPEFKKYIKGCKFSPCWHNHEPNCAVKQALEAGEIAQHRYRHYLEFLEEIRDTKGAARNYD
jgi:ribosome biogenesis GTPase